jgi:hypothetical protein
MNYYCEGNGSYLHLTAPEFALVEITSGSFPVGTTNVHRLLTHLVVLYSSVILSPTVLAAERERELELTRSGCSYIVHCENILLDVVWKNELYVFLVLYL